MWFNRPAQRTSTTDNHVLAPSGWSPRPTQDPWANELVKRQSNPVTCGFISADRRKPFTCVDPDVTCATDDLEGLLGCCPTEGPESCEIASSCVDIFESDDCDEECNSNTNIVKCFDGTCGKEIYDFGTATYTNYHCSFTSDISIYPTFTNPIVDEYISINPLSLVDGTVSIDPSPSSNPTTQSATDISGGNDDDGGSDDSINIGAIVGGVVGGLAIIAIIVIVYMILRHRRQKNRDTLAAAAATTSASGPQNFVIPKVEMPVQERALSPEQVRYGSMTTSAPNPAVMNDTSANSPDAAPHELSTVNNSS